jgi:CRP/FNR family transcriptional regulator, cyclic AMP receptor protein
MRTVNFQCGDTIIAEGDLGDTAYLITAGSVKVSVSGGGTDKSVAELSVGEVFGEMSLIDPGPRSATVTALTDTECIVTTYDELMGSLQEKPEWAIEFMKTFVRRLRHMNDLVTRMRPARQTEAEYRQCVEEAMAAFRLRE